MKRRPPDEAVEPLLAVPVFGLNARKYRSAKTLSDDGSSPVFRGMYLVSGRYYFSPEVSINP
jgi:hypothetical protein